MKGKDFFSRKAKSDFFETPYSMTEQLLEVEKFDYNKSIIESSCGNGAIVKVLNKKFNWLKFYDRFCLGDFEQTNFLTEEKNFYNYSIQNPPFSLWDEFVKQTKKVALEKFVFLGRFEFLTGLKRFNENLYFDSNYPLTKVHLFVRKVNLSFSKDYPRLREDGKYPAGMYHYAWFVFENKKSDSSYITYKDPIIKWINNQDYILKSGDIK